MASSPDGQSGSGRKILHPHSRRSQVRLPVSYRRQTSITPNANDTRSPSSSSNIQLPPFTPPNQSFTRTSPRLYSSDSSSRTDLSPLLTPPQQDQSRSWQTLSGSVDVPASNNNPDTFTFAHLQNSSSQPFTFGQLYNNTPRPSPQPERSKPVLNLNSLSDTSELSLSQLSINNDEHESGPYSIKDEKAPEAPFFNPDFQIALQKGICLTKKVAKALEHFELPAEPQSDLHRLQNDAKELSNFEPTTTRTIAVLGDSGEGKSSLINSLLHFPGIAKTGDIGSACTSVVTEYRQKTSKHNAPITIEVEYLSKPKIAELVTELLWSYRQLHLPGTKEDANAEEYRKYRIESEHAWSALQAAFGNRPGLKELLRDDTEGALDKITDQLIQWTNDLDWPQGGKDGKWLGTAQTAEDCCDITAMFMRDSFWPFTKIIRVYLNSQILKAGIVLADLPGLHDTNLARVRNTERYLLRSDYIFIVARISRAVTDHSLQSSLYTVLRQHVPLEWENSAGKYLNVAVVCTKSEETDITAQRKEFCGPGKRISQAAMEKIDYELEQAKKDGNRELKKEIKLRQKFLLMDARNSYVKEGLQRAYFAKVPEGELKVFCVSNTTYKKYCKKGIAKYVNASGIPDLRKFCYSVTAHAQFMEARHFLQSKVPCLVNSVKLWVGTVQKHPSAIRDEAKIKLRESAETLEKEVMEIINVVKSDFKDTFQDQISKLMEVQNTIWEDAAMKESSKWNSKDVQHPNQPVQHPDKPWHQSQYNAWCKNNGTHYTEERGHVRWNRDLIWKMRADHEIAWEILQDEAPVSFDKIGIRIKNLLLEFKSTINKCADAPTFVQSIHLRNLSIKHFLRVIQETLERDMRTIRRNALEDNSNSYILREMLPAYRTASQQRGTGRRKRQQADVQGRIDKHPLFANISFTIKQKMEELIETTFSTIGVQIQAVLGCIRSDLTMAYSQVRVSGDGQKEMKIKEEVERFEEELVELVELLPPAPLEGDGRTTSTSG